MDFNVHDNAGVLIGIIENPISAIWTRRYHAPGDFELEFHATKEALAMIANDFYITRDNVEEIMIVEHVEIIADKEEGNRIRISGRGAECLLDRRIVLEQTRLWWRVDDEIRRLISENAVSPTDAARTLPISLRDVTRMEHPDTGLPTISAQYTGTNLLDTVQEICKAHGLGFRAIVDNWNVVTPIIELMVGTDRSLDQDATSPVVFSDEYENLLSSSYVLDTAKYKNVAIVAGEGEGTARKRAVYGSASGMLRREMYVDARDMSTNDGEISAEDYTAQMLARGAEKLAENRITEAFDGEIDTSNNFVLDVDYTIGDIVTVSNEYGISKTERITAIMESWDASGYMAVPIFENSEV